MVFFLYLGLVNGVMWFVGVWGGFLQKKKKKKKMHLSVVLGRIPPENHLGLIGSILNVLFVVVSFSLFLFASSPWCQPSEKKIQQKKS